MTDMHREAFERCATARGEYPEAANMNGLGEYIDPYTRQRWIGWQAAIRHLTEQNEQRDSHE